MLNNLFNQLLCGRYTEWYVAGRESTRQSEFSNTYGDARLAAVTKACTTGGSCASTSTSFAGVWASEWQISSISSTLTRLKDGFEGSLAVVETTGIVLSTSTGVSLEPAISCSDSYIQKAAAVVAEDTGYTWSKASGLVVPDLVVLVSFNVVGTAQLVSNKFPEVSGKFVALMSFDQAQLYTRYEEFRTIGLILSAFGIVLITILITKRTQKFQMETQSIGAINDIAFETFTDLSSKHDVRDMLSLCTTMTQALKEHLIRCPLDYRGIRQLESNSSNNHNTDNLMVPVDEAFERLAGVFCQDLFHSQETDITLWSLLLSGCQPTEQPCCVCTMANCLLSSPQNTCYKRRVLITLFYLVRMPAYLAVVNALLVVTLLLGWLGIVILVLQVPLLGLLMIDVSLRVMFNVIETKGFESHDRSISIPSQFKQRSMVESLYVLLSLVTALTIFTDGIPNIANYAHIMMIVVRNPQIWPPIVLFSKAVLAAAPIAYLFFVFCLIISAMTLVLLNRQFTTGDYYKDSQFTNYFYALCTMSIYMIGGNFVEVRSLSERALHC